MYFGIFNKIDVLGKFSSSPGINLIVNPPLPCFLYNPLMLQSSYLPDEAGIPFGTDDDPTLLLLEMHYDNPQLQSGKQVKFVIIPS